MPAKKPAFWDVHLNSAVEKYRREHPEVDSGVVDDLYSYLVESKGWKDFEHVSDYLLSYDVKGKDPLFWSWYNEGMTSEKYEKEKMDEEQDRERIIARKKTLRDLLFDYSAEKEDLEFHKDEYSQQELDEKTKEFREKKAMLLKQLDIVKELQDEGYDYARQYLQDNSQEVIVQEVSKQIFPPLKAEVDDIRKKLNAEIQKVRRATEKIPTESTAKQDMDRVLAELARLVSLTTGKAVEPQIEAGVKDYSKIPDARAAFLRGDRPAAARILVKAGFSQPEQEPLFSSWVTERPAGRGAAVDIDAIRQAMRQEMERGARAAEPTEYEVEWIHDENNPECWDRYTLANGMRELARKKLAAQRGMPLEKIDEMIGTGELPQSELDRTVSEITSEEVFEMLVKPGRVTIIRRNPEFEARLMQMPFAWGNGYFFKLSPEGRRNAGFSSWKRLDSLCKVVEESVRQGDWTFQMVREAGIPRSFITACIREVRRESAGT